MKMFLIPSEWSSSATIVAWGFRIWLILETTSSHSTYTSISSFTRNNMEPQMENMRIAVLEQLVFHIEYDIVINESDLFTIEWNRIIEYENKSLS